jgi:hypothetical protein
MASNTVLSFQALARLVDRGDLDRRPDDDFTRIRLVRPWIMRNRVDLPAPLGPMMPTMAPGGMLKLRLSISSGRRSPC